MGALPRGRDVKRFNCLRTQKKMVRLYCQNDLILWPGGRDAGLQLRRLLDVPFKAPHYSFVHTGTLFICVHGPVHLFVCAHKQKMPAGGWQGGWPARWGRG